MSSGFVGYCARTSFIGGEGLTVHVATVETNEQCWVDVYRIVGCLESTDIPRLEFVIRSGPVSPVCYPQEAAGTRLGPGDADVEGCRWPPACALTEIPDDWPSGPYLAQFTSAPEPTYRPSTRLGQDALFILRRPPSNPTSGVLVQLGVATWNAYHIWQNRNLYIGDIGDKTGDRAAHLRAHRVSFHRPGIGLAPRSNIAVFPPTAYMYLLPFLQWASEEGLQLDYCAGTDIDLDLVNLSDYRLLVTLGHDEYWSRRQRDRVESYVQRGGNAAFFGGNIAYWQIRLADDGHSVECYKRAPDPVERMGYGGIPLDPLYRDPHLYPEHDNSDVTVEYHTPPLNRSPTSLTGASMRNDDGARAADRQGVFCGAAWWWENYGGPVRPSMGFTVIQPHHWAFEHTGLNSGETFGEAQKLIGFECDGIDVVFRDGIPTPTYRDGAPENVSILAYADCSDWAETDYSVTPPIHTPGRRLNNATLGGVVTMLAWDSAGGGQVFNAPVTDWPRALVDLVDYTAAAAGTRRIAPASAEVRTITANVLRHLGGAKRTLGIDLPTNPRRHRPSTIETSSIESFAEGQVDRKAAASVLSTLD